MPGIIDAVVEAGTNIYAFARYCPTSEEKDVNIEPLRYRQLLAECDKKFKEVKQRDVRLILIRRITFGLYMNMKQENSRFDTAEKGMIYGGCHCGSGHLTILPTGDVYACRRVQNSKVGNVFEDRLADPWVCEVEKYRDFNKFEKM